MPKIKGIESHDFKQKKIWFFLIEMETLSYYNGLLNKSNRCVFIDLKKNSLELKIGIVLLKRQYKLVKSFWNAVWWTSEQLII